MAKTKFQLNLPGINQLMKSPEMQAQLEAAGQAVASVADGNYDTAAHTLNYFVQVNVFPADKESARKNSRQNELLKAAEAVGLRMG
jgi:hypothetical protein